MLRLQQTRSKSQKDPATMDNDREIALQLIADAVEDTPFTIRSVAVYFELVGALRIELLALLRTNDHLDEETTYTLTLSYLTSTYASAIATDHINAYRADMKLLLQEFDRLRTSRPRARRSGKLVRGEIDEQVFRSAGILRGLVMVTPDQEYVDERYLTRIFHYWRRFGGRAEAALYEDVWVFVSGRNMTTFE